MELVETLKAQHGLVLKLVEKVDAAVAARDVAQIGEHLGAMKTALAAHLLLEDEKLYPRLIELATARNNPAQVNVAKLFASNMRNISDALHRFLARYSGSVDLARFSADWSSIKRVLGERINSEEAWLYPLYASLSSPPENKKTA